MARARHAGVVGAITGSGLRSCRFVLGSPRAGAISDGGCVIGARCDGPTPFDTHAAERALGATAKAVARCRHGKVFGHGQARVTFGGDGAVAECVVSGRFTDTPAGACVVAALSAVHAAPFGGEPQTIVHSFDVAPR